MNREFSILLLLILNFDIFLQKKNKIDSKIKKKMIAKMNLKKLDRKLKTLDPETRKLLLTIGSDPKFLKSLGIDPRKLFLGMDPIKSLFYGLLGVGGYAYFNRRSENNFKESMEHDISEKRKYLNNLKFKKSNTMEELKRKLVSLVSDVESFTSMNELSLGSIKENTNIRLKLIDIK